jgi:hypothetical protein
MLLDQASIAGVPYLYRGLALEIIAGFFQQRQETFMFSDIRLL